MKTFLMLVLDKEKFPILQYYNLKQIFSCINAFQKFTKAIGNELLA